MLVAVWALIASVSEPVSVPGPSLVWEALRRNFWEAESLAFVAFGSGGLVQNLGYTVTNVLIGVGLGAVAGVVVGVFIARFRLLREALEPPLVLLGTVPILVLVPFLTFWFGTSRLATNGLVIFYTFVMVSVVADQATCNVSGYFEQHAQSLGASQARIMREVVAPAIVPAVYRGDPRRARVRLGLPRPSRRCSAARRIGRILRVFSQSSSTAEMFAAIICVGVTAVVIDGLVAAIGRVLVRWKG